MHFSMQVRATSELVPQNSNDQQLVERVGRRIVDALPKPSDHIDGYRNHLRRYKWEFVVVKSKEKNAFVVPGGKVVVYTGALSKPILGVQMIALGFK